MLTLIGLTGKEALVTAAKFGKAVGVPVVIEY